MNVLWFKQVDATLPQLRASRVDATRTALTGLFDGQRRVVIARFRAGNLAMLETDFTDRLAATMFRENKATAVDYGRRVEAELSGKQFFPEDLDAFLTAGAAFAAANIVSSVNDLIAAAILDGIDGLHATFDGVADVQAPMWSETMVTGSANFGAHEGARSSGAGTKTWQVNSGNPRDTHSALAGESVALADTFSNGQRWPGDPSGGAAETANCQCSMGFE